MRGAEEPKAKTLPLTEAQQLRVENLSLKQALIDRQREDLMKEQNAFITDVCKSAGIDLKACSVDPQSKTVREVLPPKPEAPPAKK